MTTYHAYTVIVFIKYSMSNTALCGMELTELDSERSELNQVLIRLIIVTLVGMLNSKPHFNIGTYAM